MMAACPENPGPLTLCMAARPALDMLKELNVVAVSLANNHSHDCGDLAFRTMQRLLTEAGITVLANRTVTDLGPFRLAALTDLDNRPEPARALLRDADLNLFTPHQTGQAPLRLGALGRGVQGGSRSQGTGPGRQA